MYLINQNISRYLMYNACRRLFKFRNVQLYCTHRKINLIVDPYIRVQNLVFNRICNSIQSQKYMFSVKWNSTTKENWKMWLGKTWTRDSVFNTSWTSHSPLWVSYFSSTKKGIGISDLPTSPSCYEDCMFSLPFINYGFTFSVKYWAALLMLFT